MKRPSDFFKSNARFCIVGGFIIGIFTMIAHAYDINEERRMLCENINNSYQCAQAVENAAMKKFPKVAERREGQLTLFAAGKPIASFSDSEDKKFTFQGLSGDMGYALLEVQYSEGSDFLLIHLGSGQQTRIKGLPVISPDRQRFVTASGDEGDFTQTALEVFDIHGSSPSLETSVSLEGAGWPVNPRWVTAKTIEFWMINQQGSKTVRKVYWTATGWRLKPQNPVAP